MLRPMLAALAALIVLASCGAASLGSPSGPTPASVAVQPGDLPSGMHKCDLTGDIDSFLNMAKAKNPNTYTATKAEWDTAKKNGATAAYVAFYADSAQHCTQVGSSSSDLSTANFKLVVNFVIQFKDEASAAKGYTTETIFGFSAASLKGGGAPVQEGTATGLGANSTLLTVSVAGQSFYVAVWQQKTFMVILVALDLDTAASKKAALAEDGRIK